MQKKNISTPLKMLEPLSPQKKSEDKNYGIGATIRIGWEI